MVYWLNSFMTSSKTSIFPSRPCQRRHVGAAGVQGGRVQRNRGASHPSAPCQQWGNVFGIPILFVFFNCAQYLYNIKFFILTIFKCTIQGDQLHSHCCVKINTIYFQTLPLPKQKLCSHRAFTPQASILLAAFMNLPILDISDKWNHEVFILMCLAYFTQ